jgi:hypothetical protein
VFINTQTFINIPAKGWYNTMGGLPAIWAEYNTVDAQGNPVDLSQRETYYYYWIDEAKTQKAEVFNVKNTLTAEEAAQYTLKNVLSGDDNWQPDLLCEAVEAPVPVFNGNKIEWEAVPYAICYVVTKGDEVVSITTETSFDLPDSGTMDVSNEQSDAYAVQAVNEQGGLSKLAIATEPTAVSSISASANAYDAAPVKYIKDGRLYIGNYNALGQRVK